MKAVTGMHYDKNYLQDIRFIGFLYRKAYSISKTFWIPMVLAAAATALAEVLWTYVPKLVIDGLTGGKRLGYVLQMMAAFALMQLIVSCVSLGCENWLNLSSRKIYHRLKRDMAEKVMKLDCVRLEDPKILDLKDRAYEGIDFWGGIMGINAMLMEGGAALLSIGALLVLILQLNWVFGLLLLLFAAAKTVLSNKLRVVVMGFWDKLGVFNRQFRYLGSLMTDYKYGKDIRLHRMQDLICKKSEAYREETLRYYVKQGKKERQFYYLQNIVELLQTLAIYGFVVWYAWSGELGLGSVVLYITAATSVVTNSAKVAGQIVEMKRICQYGAPYREFMELPEAERQGSSPVPEKSRFRLEAREVSFRYPGSDRDVLKDVSFVMEPGQKISIVGLNGAGKTTLIKLLLRLYEPTGGQILLDGRDIREYSPESYWEKFSVVFQDFRLPAAQIRENIACGQEADGEKLREALEKVGLWEKIDSLPGKENTHISRKFHEDGVELSGGQNQKLAIARAIYKDAPFVFLDEPTANLDPIAEYEIFRNFDALVKGKTTVYISHRLSTCRLSDRILVIDNGSIAEVGTHEQLLEKAGLYKQMWDAQAQYYVDG